MKATEKTVTGRLRSRAEIKTPEHIVKQMVDNLGEVTLDATYLEICCWGAPFLVEILKRKLKLCKDYEDVLTAYKTIFGYELQEDNLEEGREKLKALYPDDPNINLIVNTNLVLMDGLTQLNPKTGEKVKFYNWKNNRWDYLDGRT